MQNKLAVATAAILVTLACINADLCSSGSTEIGGNWYCQAVQAIQYSNVGTAGSYNQVTAMSSDGSCSSTPKSFSGPLSPLDEEVGPFLDRSEILVRMQTNAPIGLSPLPWPIRTEATCSLYPINGNFED